MRTGAWMCTLILLTGCGEDVTVQVEGQGRVTSVPPGIDCGVACTKKVDSGSQLQLMVQPAPGSIFAGWGGACSGQKETCTIVVDSPASITVKLAKLHKIEIQKKGDGKGVITSNPPGIDCGEKCSGEFPDDTKLQLDVSPELGVKIVNVGPCGSKVPCSVDVRAPLRVDVELDVVPGALLSSHRIDDEGGGAFLLDSSGNVVWSKEQRVETFGADGKRMRRSSLTDTKIVTPRALAARPDDVVVVAGDGAENSIVASIKPTGDVAWTIELPGKVMGAGSWTKGAVVALAIDDKITIGERTYGQKKKNDVVIVWLDDAGKVSDSSALKIPITAETAAFTVDGTGAAIIAVKAGKKHVLAKAAGTEGQAWNVKVGELERAFLATNEAGDIWLAGTALSLEEDLREAGVKVEKGKSPCADTGFGFVAKYNAAGQVQSGRVLERGIAGFGLDPQGALVAAAEFVGDVTTSTGGFTSAGFASKIGDCDQKCSNECIDPNSDPCDRCKTTCAAEREAAMGEALCTTEPDVLIGALDANYDFTWVRQLSVEGELSLEGFIVRSDGITFAAVMSEGRMRVVGGARDASIPSGVSVVVFR